MTHLADQGRVGNPYRIEGPALISFSGGRTSAYMLKQIVDAHGGALPSNVHVVFCNTGKEREETLRFVHECGERWGVRIHWLEWRDRRKRTPVDDRFEEVGFNSAARKGEPFKALIASKKAVPNAVQRWCTEHLKMQVCADFMEAQGYASWTNVVGLRADEMRRVAKKVAQNEEGKLPWQTVMPLMKAGVTKRDVRRFWFGQDTVDLTIPADLLPQGFDLGLEEWEGNCTKCFNKSKALLIWDVRRDPADALDWAAMEDSVGGTFTTEYSFHDLIREAESSPRLPLGDDFTEFDAECGVGGVDTSIRCGRTAA
ncbi:phosphoadenosine phosphosulfate reductase domain-containing protein [Sphingomonas oryzagri]|uniref:Phosphoadenosine phosphosulfate reductase family protein n=1 Tax=Sphingomonas oryzagri TaxID=3042314 RepID=A0ABT6N103_9SPHN|nr:phosphoadenosine phosphosulfate reductase family protein [Sphingomonas oryzagri]MDH7638984.1 phosphoadenosine phosphosulfate reductase family protein [Sphingomonas oryzagri]